MKKSIVQMAHHLDGGDINTASYAVERSNADPRLLKLLESSMDGYEYGEVPRKISLHKGTLILAKVDDGLYSGFFRILEEVETAEGIDSMEDTAKVRIEKQTLPTLANFLVAKEWWCPVEEQKEVRGGGYMFVSELQSYADNDDYEDLIDALECEASETESPLPGVEDSSSGLDKKILILELLNKLLS